MDAEKNVVEAARAVVATRGWDLLGGSHEKIVALRAALSAYDSAPAPSEDRVREAAGRCVRALLMDSRCTEGDRLAIKKRGSDGNEHDLGAWSHDAALNVIAEALRPYVTPAPALPAGTVAVSVETLKTWRARAIERQRVLREGHGLRCELPTVAEIDALLPPPPRPEPPKDLELKWHNAGCLLANKRGYSSFNAPGAQDFVNGYVAALRDLRKP